MLLGGPTIGSMCFGSGLEHSQVIDTSVDVNLSDKFIQLSLIVDAFISTGVIDPSSRIPRILTIGCDPQIHEAIIGSVAVDVIDVPDRPLSCDVEPGQAMCHIQAAVDPDVPIPAGLSATGNRQQHRLKSYWYRCARRMSRYRARSLADDGLRRSHGRSHGPLALAPTSYAACD